MPDRLPNRKQARTIVTCVAIFWTCWGVGVAGIKTFGPAVIPVMLIGILFCIRGYIALYEVWEPESGESAWRMMFFPSFRKERARIGMRVGTDLFRPRWIRHTIRETGWNPKVVGFGLLGIFLADVLVAIFVFPHQFN